MWPPDGTEFILPCSESVKSVHSSIRFTYNVQANTKYHKSSINQTSSPTSLIFIFLPVICEMWCTQSQYSAIVFFDLCHYSIIPFIVVIDFAVYLLLTSFLNVNKKYKAMYESVFCRLWKWICNNMLHNTSIEAPAIVVM